MPTSFSDLILQALAKHGRLNCRQLAAKISHDSKKTTQLVGFMRTNKKLKTDGEVDGLAAYSLTEIGRSLVPVDPLRSEPGRAEPSSLDDLAEVQLHPARQQSILDATAHIQANLQTLAARQSEQPAPAFGLLNTGEFLIMAEGHTIKIPAEHVPAMRAQLNRPAAGAFQ